VNNAGAGERRAFVALDDEAWQASVELNLLAAVRLIRAAIPALRTGGQGAIDELAATVARDNVLLGRLGTQMDVAPLVVFLASAVTAGYITGVAVEVDGGLGRGVAIRGLG
jgi:NAD(P)-dependent dehydrogenase (short-subunit alcohol dehydrogenase family)